MWSNVCHVLFWIMTCCFLKLVLCSQSCTTLGTIFKAPPYATSGGGSEMTRHPIYSTIECGHACTIAGDKCATFHYNPDTKTCHMSDGMMDGLVGSVYGRRGNADCPSAMGYFLHGYDNICMKLHTKWPTFDNATAECQSEGAQLMTIEDEHMHLFIKRVLTCIGSDNIVLIDGFDPQKNNNYKSWNGEPLPYYGWGSGEPQDARQQCLRLLRSAGYDFSTARCKVGSSPKDYLCRRNMLE